MTWRPREKTADRPFLESDLDTEMLASLTKTAGEIYCQLRREEEHPEFYHDAMVHESVSFTLQLFNKVAVRVCDEVNDRYELLKREQRAKDIEAGAVAKGGDA